MVSVLYGECALFCAILLIFILFRTNSVIEYSISGKIFKILIICSIFFCGIDSLWGFIASQVFGENFLLFNVCSYLFHICASCISLVWYTFCLKYLGKKYSSAFSLRIIPFFLIAFELALIVSNLYFPNVFSIDENYVYHSEPLRSVLFTSQWLNFFIMFLCSFISYRSDKDAERRLYSKNAILFSLIPLGTGVMQFIFPDSPVYSLGYTLSVFTIYAYTINHENAILMIENQNQKNLEEYQKKLRRDVAVLSSISGKYEIILLIDDSDNNVNILNTTERVRRFLPEGKDVIQGVELDNFFEQTIREENLESFIKSVDREKISKACLNGQRVSIDYTAFIDNKDVQFRIYFAVDKENSNNFLIAIRNIDEEYYMRQEIEDQKKVISNLEMQNQMAFEIASMDGLTGLINKISFIEKVERYLAENSSENCALIFFDMDHFKKINDLFGHNTGDDALRDMARKLKSLFRSDELIARMGGDEFCIFLPLISLNLVKERIAQMNKTLIAEYSDENNKIRTSASIGCAYCESKDVTYVEMHSEADKAMYEVKRQGRNSSLIKVI